MVVMRNSWWKVRHEFEHNDYIMAYFSDPAYPTNTRSDERRRIGDIAEDGVQYFVGQRAKSHRKLICGRRRKRKRKRKTLWLSRVSSNSVIAEIAQSDIDHNPNHSNSKQQAEGE